MRSHSPHRALGSAPLSTQASQAHERVHSSFRSSVFWAFLPSFTDNNIPWNFYQPTLTNIPWKLYSRSAVRDYRLSVLQLDALRFFARRDAAVADLARYQDSERSEAAIRCDALLRRGMIRVVEGSRPRVYVVTAVGESEIEMIDTKRARCSKCNRVQAKDAFYAVASRDAPSTVCKVCRKLKTGARRVKARQQGEK